MLIEGPFESDYSLAIVNRRLALALKRLGHEIQLHQRDNTTHYAPDSSFLKAWPELAPHFVESISGSTQTVHSRYIYPPFTDAMQGLLKVVHCYGWEETAFPRDYADAFNRDLDVITVMSTFVRDVLVQNGVTVPIEIVGLGADHILEYAPEPVACFAPGQFHFVHVSSCFPRKGADVLVEAFCREFRRDDGVSLLIKTFPNPHNEIAKIVDEAFSRHPDHPPISIIMESFSPGKMRFLLQEADCLVAPSRGEGFGLPVAEAMLLGTPVIATVYGGHTDLCSAEWCWPVDFQLQQARTHLTEGHSFWAEPDPDSLRRQMREVYRRNPEEILLKTRRATAHIAGTFTWPQVADRHAKACSVALEKKRNPPLHSGSAPRGPLGIVTTWNARCGIAEYTRYLAGGLPAGHDFLVFANRVPAAVRPDEPNVSRCWTATPEALPPAELDELARQVSEGGCDTVSIQYNFSLLAPETMEGLVRRLRRKNVSVVVTLHSTGSAGDDADSTWVRGRYTRLLEVLKDVQGIIVHRREEQDRLLAAGLRHVYLQRQGIYTGQHMERSAPPGSRDVFTLSCFGFFLPPKGIYELIHAFSAAVSVNPGLRLKLINSLYDLPASRAYAAEVLMLLRSLGITDRVLVSTQFLDQDTILRELAESDLVVLPYTRSTESSSAAIRLPLASLTPLLCSDLEIFREFEGIVHSYQAHDTVALANCLLQLSSDPKLLRSFETRQREYVGELAWSNVARDFQAIINSCSPAAHEVVS